MKYIAQNKWWQHLINWLTYKWVSFKINKKIKPELEVDKELKPLWITGFFRSGTSLTTQIVSCLGYDAGPQNHLLQAKGNRAAWNPNGFGENFLFMDWSLTAFEQMDAWGHQPPSEKDLMDYNINDLSHKSFVKKSIVEIHDDRISNRNKASILKSYFPQNLNAYLRQNFNEKCTIKNPHFALLHPILVKYWPNSSFLLVFRNPDAAIASAEKITGTLNYNLYIQYYLPIVQDQNLSVIYFSYDHLLANPKGSLEELSRALGANDKGVTEAMALINFDLNRHGQAANPVKWPHELTQLYNEMKLKAVNCE